MGSLMFHMYFSAWYLRVLEPFYACTCTHWRPACVRTYPKLVMFVHVSARIKRWACFASFSFDSGMSCVSAFVCALVLSVRLHVGRELSICWHVSRAEHLLARFKSWAFVGTFQELSVYLQSVSYVESWGSHFSWLAYHDWCINIEKSYSGPWSGIPLRLHCVWAKYILRVGEL